MIVTGLKLRDFRSYERLELELPPRVSIFYGANGAGKTNLLEAVYMGAVGRSCRTNVDTRTIRFGADVARVELSGEQDGQRHTLAVATTRSEGKSLTVDGSAVASFEDVELRPLVAVFMPDRLELVKGAPGARRAHFDQVIAALWPARRETRKSYAAALAQRNAVIARGDPNSPLLDAWDRELASHGTALSRDRAELVGELAADLTAAGESVGIESELDLIYRPSLAAASEDEYLAELAERRASDATRGFTGAGPHRDEFALRLGDRDLRIYGSQGQQRIALLALLLAECTLLADVTGRTPLVLLDDVMSELDAARRASLLAHVATLAQCVVTTTDLAHVPDASAIDAAYEVAGGTVTPAGAG